MRTNLSNKKIDYIKSEKNWEKGEKLVVLKTTKL